MKKFNQNLTFLFLLVIFSLCSSNNFSFAQEDVKVDTAAPQADTQTDNPTYEPTYEDTATAQEDTSLPEIAPGDNFSEPHIPSQVLGPPVQASILSVPPSSSSTQPATTSTSQTTTTSKTTAQGTSEASEQQTQSNEQGINTESYQPIAFSTTCSSSDCSGCPHALISERVGYLDDICNLSHKSATGNPQ